MIDRTSQDIEGRIQTATNLTPQQKQELQGLVTSLKGEVFELSQGHREGKGTLGDFIRAFETSHPALTMRVNDFCTYLANIGI
jgi:hypothetical protein